MGYKREMGFIARYVWAPVLDFVMRQEPVMRERRKVVPLAAGRVLEVGVGSGLNLGLYDPDRVEKVWGLDPAVELQDRSRPRAAASRIEVELLTGSAEDIPFEDASFDTVVTTFTLCSIPAVDRALAQMRRVLKPAGRLLFAEHGLSSDANVARWQNLLNPAWLLVSNGCHINRPIESLVRQGGFTIEHAATQYLPGPRILNYNYSGIAVRA